MSFDIPSRDLFSQNVVDMTLKTDASILDLRLENVTGAYYWIPRCDALWLIVEKAIAVRMCDKQKPILRLSLHEKLRSVNVNAFAIKTQKTPNKNIKKFKCRKGTKEKYMIFFLIPFGKKLHMRIQTNYHPARGKVSIFTASSRPQNDDWKIPFFSYRELWKMQQNELMEDFLSMKGIRGKCTSWKRWKYTKPIAVIIINSKTHIHMRS